MPRGPKKMKKKNIMRLIFYQFNDNNVQSGADKNPKVIFFDYINNVFLFIFDEIIVKCIVIINLPSTKNIK